MKTTNTIDALKIADVTIQTLFIVAAAISLFNRIGISFYYAQFFLGVWQMAGSLISSVFRRRYYQIKRWHFVIAVIYVLTLMYGDVTTIWLWIVPAWLLALFYYTITWLTMIPSKKRSSFLPNLSF
jgi:hypothetical protein